MGDIQSNITGLKDTAFKVRQDVKGVMGRAPHDIELHPEVRRALLVKGADTLTPTLAPPTPFETLWGMRIVQDPSLPRDEAQIRYIDREGVPQTVRIKF